MRILFGFVLIYLFFSFRLVLQRITRSVIKVNLCVPFLLRAKRTFVTLSIGTAGSVVSYAQGYLPRSIKSLLSDLTVPPLATESRTPYFTCK